MKFNKILLILLVVCLVASMLVSCNNTTPGEQETSGDSKPEWVDYASQVKLDMTSDTLKINATVKSYIDGDTTHFYVDSSVCADGILKARYLAINTPESTGKIEEWGKAASKFTRSKLENAVSIILFDVGGE